ncbi:unnamed protein product [Cuscuta campestris]|uniref:Pentacotripeptide-repeat region of PRORP domain-containing protein n=1 Tax=Cuscuta campestris TaxID=132261 RepID=A0A484N3G7_9ASTE|nr:unnamed protein product [Cuscuta campestris]
MISRIRISSRPSFHSFTRFSSSATSLDLRNCIASLQACAKQRNLKPGRQLHAFMLVSGLVNSSPICITSLVNMYSKCNPNSMSDALSVFSTSPPQSRTVFVYNALISGFVAHDSPKEVLQIYSEMRIFGLVPDKFTFPCVIKAASSCKQILCMKNYHGLVFKLGLEFDSFIGSALMHSYLTFGLTEDAEEVFDELPVRDDVVLWNAMINGYSQSGKFDRAVEVFTRMTDDEVSPNRFTITGVLSALSNTESLHRGREMHGFVIRKGHDEGIAVQNALIDMYGKCKRTSDALQVFEMMDEKDIFSWNSILCVYEQCGDNEGTLKLFKRMLCTQMQPDLVTVTTVLPACAHLAALRHGKEIHAYMILSMLKNNNCDNDSYIDNAIMDMYAKCGSLDDAQMLFDTIINKDVASWNIMIKGYGMHGHGKKALHMFSRMCEKGVKPDEVTFVGVLSACSHSGLIDQGRDFLLNMLPIHGIVPRIEHYTCVIDMLGRAGQLKAAYDLLLAMPVNPNPVVWRAFLAACRLHGNADLAVVAAGKVLELNPEHCGNYVMLSNVYGAGDRYEEVTEVREVMRAQDVRKVPGCSWIELNNGVHSFFTSDKTHPEGDLIYAGLNSLTAKLREHNGYSVDDALECS